jgi:hydrogenase maturation factor
LNMRDSRSLADAALSRSSQTRACFFNLESLSPDMASAFRAAFSPVSDITSDTGECYDFPSRIQSISGFRGFFDFGGKKRREVVDVITSIVDKENIFVALSTLAPPLFASGILASDLGLPFKKALLTKLIDLAIKTPNIMVELYGYELMMLETYGSNSGLRKLFEGKEGKKFVSKSLKELVVPAFSFSTIESLKDQKPIEVRRELIDKTRNLYELLLPTREDEFGDFVLVAAGHAILSAFKEREFPEGTLSGREIFTEIRRVSAPYIEALEKRYGERSSARQFFNEMARRYLL